jgi:hypothetical protein
VWDWEEKIGEVNRGNSNLKYGEFRNKNKEEEGGGGGGGGEEGEEGEEEGGGGREETFFFDFSSIIEANCEVFLPLLSDERGKGKEGGEGEEEGKGERDKWTSKHSRIFGSLIKIRWKSS